MLSRLPHLLAVSAIVVSLTGCFAAAPEIQTITERVYIPCPLSPPPGECPDWFPLSQPVDMLESSADALVGAPHPRPVQGMDRETAGGGSDLPREAYWD